MKVVFKNKKLELIGLVAWSLLSFGVINISVQISQSFFISIILSTLVCSFLNSFFFLAYRRYEISTSTLWSFVLIYTFLIIIFQILFDLLVRLNGSMVGYIGYIITGALLIFFTITSATLIRSLSNAKR